MKKKIRVILSEDAREVYEYLLEKAKDRKFENSILKSLIKKKDILKIDRHYGDPISKDKFPKKYVELFNIKNLFRVELPNYWRMLYTLTNNGEDIEIICFVLDIVPHDDYNKLFKYKKK